MSSFAQDGWCTNWTAWCRRRQDEAARRFAGEYIELIVFSLAGVESAWADGGGGRVGKRIAAGEPRRQHHLPATERALDRERAHLVLRTGRRCPPSRVRRRPRSTPGRDDADDHRPSRVRHRRRRAPFSPVGLRPVCEASRGARPRHRTARAPARHGVQLAAAASRRRSTRPNRGTYIPGRGGYRLDDTVVVGHVPEVLTSTPTDLSWLSVG